MSTKMETIYKCSKCQEYFGFTFFPKNNKQGMFFLPSSKNGIIKEYSK